MTNVIACLLSMVVMISCQNPCNEIQVESRSTYDDFFSIENNISIEKIDSLFICAEQFPKTFAPIVLNICVGGKWHADEVNYFIKKARKFIISNPEVSRTLFLKHTEEERISIFSFLIDGPEPTAKRDLEFIDQFVVIIDHESLSEEMAQHILLKKINEWAH